jgi:hypothetical protein
MTARGHTRAWLVALVLSAAACGDDSREPLAHAPGPTASQTEQAEITGSILGPDGTSICNSVPAGTEFSVHVLDPVNVVVAALQDVACPANTYAIPVDPGSYFVRAEFLTFDGIDGFPFRNLVPVSAAPPEDPGDLRYIQSVSPVTLKQGRSTDLWLAVIAGESEAAFLATAETAARDIETHRRIPQPVAERGAPRLLGRSLVRASAAGPVRRPVCLKDCLRELKERSRASLHIQER